MPKLTLDPASRLAELARTTRDRYPAVRAGLADTDHLRPVTAVEDLAVGDVVYARLRGSVRGAVVIGLNRTTIDVAFAQRSTGDRVLTARTPLTAGGQRSTPLPLVYFLMGRDPDTRARQLAAANIAAAFVRAGVGR